MRDGPACAVPDSSHMHAWNLSCTSRPAAVPTGERTAPLEAGDRLLVQVFRVEKEGMPLFDHPDRSGDMFVTITVAFPAKLTEAHKESVRKIFKGFHDEL